MKTILVYAAGWLGMVILAIVNGTLREKLYGGYMSELAAHQLSTLIAIALFGLYIFAMSRMWKLSSAAEALAIGVMWLVMTVSFEFLFGHYAMGHSWEKLLHDYGLFAGRLWALLLLWTTVAPYLFYRLGRFQK